jgi:hypothetical protein
MALINYNRIERAVKFDKNVYKEIRDDKNGYKEGLIVLLVAGIIGSIWSIISSSGVALIWLLIGMPFTWLIFGGMIHLFAKMLGGKATYSSYLGAMGYAEAPIAMGIIPIIGSTIGGFWSFGCMVCATQIAHEISFHKATLAVLMPVIIIVLLIVLISMTGYMSGVSMLGGY